MELDQLLRTAPVPETGPAQSGRHRCAAALYAVVKDVEVQYPELAGGLSAYPANSAHGPFVHVDARGVRARW